MNKAIGLIEVVGLTKAIVAADECVKAASVNLLGLEKVSGGIVTVKIIGDVSAVSAAVEAGRSMVEHSGMFRSAHVIPRLHEEVLSIVQDKQETKEEIKQTNDEITNDITEEFSEGVVEEVVEALAEEFQTMMIEAVDETVKNTSEVKLQKEHVEVNEETKVEEKIQTEDDSKKKTAPKAKSKTEELTKEKLSKMTVKELRQLAISTKVAKTWKEAKGLKKEDLIDELLK